MPHTSSSRRRAAVAILVSILGAAALPMIDARAQTVFEVEVGRLIRQGNLSKESMRFYPAELQVHQGDVVRFRSVGFHGVALLPLGETATGWAAANAGGIGRPWSLFEADSD